MADAKGEELEDSPVELVELWSDPVDGNAVANAIRKAARRHLVLPEGGAEIVALWCLGTYCYHAFRLFPKLLISSPEKRCGKTTLLEFIEAMCRSAVLASNVTSAVLFRLVDAYRPTLLFDEADRWLKDDDQLVAIVDAGHTRRSAFVWAHGRRRPHADEVLGMGRDGDRRHQDTRRYDRRSQHRDRNAPEGARRETRPTTLRSSTNSASRSGRSANDGRSITQTRCAPRILLCRPSATTALKITGGCC